VTNSPQRQHAIGTFFAANAERVRRTVAAHARTVADATIEDACQIAWAKLLRRPDIELSERGLSWLITVAVREAWRLGAGARSERPARALRTPQPSRGELPEPPADTRDIADLVEPSVSPLGNRREF
jgi:DNA-directed RNA polymerase specialized sigma24 family protein